MKKYKKCPDCGQRKEIIEFRWRNKSQGITHTRCKPCDKIFRKLRYKSKSNSEINKRCLENRIKKIKSGEMKISSHKICLDCQEIKEFDEFRWINKSLGFKQPRCKSCDKLYRAKLYIERKQQYIDNKHRHIKKLSFAIKEQKNKPCFDCGKIFNICAMEFDHLNPEIKILQLSRMPYHYPSWAKISEEIAKCDVICVNCHRLRECRRAGHKHDGTDDLSIRNRKLIWKLKSAPCNICEIIFSPCQMDFDHRNPAEKIKNVSALAGCSLETLTKEIEKCNILCANCHREKTCLENGWCKKVGKNEY